MSWGRKNGDTSHRWSSRRALNQLTSNSQNIRDSAISKYSPLAHWYQVIPLLMPVPAYQFWTKNISSPSSEKHSCKTNVSFLDNILYSAFEHDAQSHTLAHYTLSQGLFFCRQSISLAGNLLRSTLAHTLLARQKYWYMLSKQVFCTQNKGWKNRKIQKMNHIWMLFYVTCYKTLFLSKSLSSHPHPV